MRIRDQWVAAFAATVMLTATALSVLAYRQQRSALIHGIDQQLLTVIQCAKAMLPEDFHNRVVDANSVPAEEYRRIVERNNALCRALGLQYIWSVLVDDGAIRFTTATSPSLDVTQGDYAGFFEVHRDPPAFDAVLATMQPDFSEFHNEWGDGRMVLVPYRDGRGRPYCFGASMSIEVVDALVHQGTLHALGVGILALGVGVSVGLVLAHAVTRPLRQLTAMAEDIANGQRAREVNIGGSLELVSLSQSINTMNRKIQEELDRQGEEIKRRRDTEGALRIKDAAIASSIHAMALANLRGRPTYVNKAFLDLWGYENEAEVLGRRVEAFWEDDISHVARAIAREGRFNGELTARRKDGTTFPARVSTHTIVNEATARPLAVMASSVDITRERLLENQLRQAQKMEAIGQLAGGVAHDFNNLLQVINGHADMAMEALPPDCEARVNLLEVAGAGRRAASIVAQLLAFSRRQVIQPVDLDLNAVVSELLKMLRRLIGEHIQLDFLPARHLASVCADRSTMEQVLINLCVNARDAMSAGGRVTIETENVVVDDVFCEKHAWAMPGRYVLLGVTDTGCGMDKETRERIFEPFFTTKKMGHGTGLGLATVYGVVKQHGGMIHCYSEPGKGTMFKVYLPATEPRAYVVDSRIEAAPAGGHEAILLAEDDEQVRELTRRVLERAGYTVTAVSNGEAAVAAFHECGSTIDLLMLDVVMPRMGGREAYERIQKMRPGIPALFASGYSENAVHTNFVLNEGLTLIQKPFAGHSLLRAVRKVLDAGH
ncbi:MAG TPA: ATP-binding protein [Candidatus Hydrogenedentes bacterium]|nr:ATP-binding protein [Candidatus Hydrogenedentota bacterium]HPG68980.1 ATP-binding protein [Candidatus Hydrogenedentota bacterium]